MKLKTLAPWKKSYDQPRQLIKKQRHHFANKGLSSQGMVLPVVMYGCEGWTLKKAEHQRMILLNCGVGEDSWESLILQGDPTIHPKGWIQAWIVIGRIDVEAETLVLWPPDVKNWLIWKDPDAGKDWRWEEEGMTEDEMVGWHHRLNGHEFEQAMGVGDGQGGLACCSSWGHKESDITERLNWSELKTCSIIQFSKHFLIAQYTTKY